MPLRPLKVVRGYLPHAEGSCLFSMGGTTVLCVATIEEKVPPFIERKGTGQGWLTAEYAMLPRAGKERTPRSKGAAGGRSQEISRLVGRSLRSVIDLSALGPRTVTVDCDVIKADGGTRTASINGAFIAVWDALRGLQRRGVLSRLPVRDHCAAVSVGIVQGKPVLDLCAVQDNGADVDMNVVMTGSGDLIEVQGTAEGAPFSRAQLDKLLALAATGIRAVLRVQRKYCR